MSRSQSRKSFDIAKSEVWQAWLAVKANRGAAGVDRVELTEFEADVQNNLYTVWNRMSSGSYFPPPVRSVDIPKPDGGVRTLGVPTIADRVAQTVAAKRLETAVEPLFADDSFGFRPGRSAHDAVEVCRQRCWKRRFVIDLDIRRFFDCVDWQLLMRAVEKLDVPAWVGLYVRRWLAVDAVDADGDHTVRERGTPQGGPISPVLANVFLHYAFDAWITREWPQVEWERYADDAIVHCSSYHQARRVLEAIKARMGEVGLELHPDKTKIVYCGKDRADWWTGPRKFTFLGFEFRRRRAHTKDGKPITAFSPAASPQALKRIGQTIRSWKLAQRTDLSFADIAGRINPIVRGWMTYYGRFRPSELDQSLRRLNRTLMEWARNKWRRYRPWKRIQARWKQIVTQHPTYLAHWRWTTNF